MRLAVRAYYERRFTDHRINSLQTVGRCDERIAGDAGIRRIDSAVGRTGVPFVDRGVELHARIRTLPRCETDFFPKVGRMQALVDSTIGSTNQIPRLARVQPSEELVRNANGVIRVLARNGSVSLRIPIRIVGLD